VRLPAASAASVAFVLVLATPAAAAPRVIEDDYPRALALAKAKDLPIFVDAWAPW